MSKEADVRVVRLRDYQPPAYRIVSTDLIFELADGETRVSSRLRIVRDGSTPPGAPLVLDGVDLELLGVSIDGVPLGGNQYRVDAESLTILDAPVEGELGIVTRIRPETNAALEGLYKSGGMYCTQCEPEGFRRITYYLDRPDVLARFRTTIIADPARYPVALSNGNPVADRLQADGRRVVTWEDPFPKPSYLFALVAGDLALLEDSFVTASGRRVALRIYSEPHNIGQCGYAMGALQRAMRWDEETCGREYDLDIFMIVAVDDFNMGAMENKGLNIFNTSAVLASPDTATDASYQRVEGIVGHEYFHNWSGNRVTCRDWFQLSLKEGFTVFRDGQFSGDMNSRTVERIETVNLLRSVQFPEDSGPLAHSVRPESYLEIGNFYTPTVYEKGGEVVRMLYTLLGPDRFRAGSDLYFARHDGSAATTDDFVAAMSEAGAVDLDQFRLWYGQAGTPVIRMRSEWQDGRLTVHFEQHCPPTPGQPVKQPMHIPVLVGLLDAEGRELATPLLRPVCDDPVEFRATGDTAGYLLHLRSPACQMVVDGLVGRPTLSVMRNFSAPVRLEYDRSSDELAFLAEHDTDGFARWDALQSLLVADLGRRMQGVGSDGVVVELFGRLLDHALCAPTAAEPMAMLAVMLRLPDENYLYEQIAPVDVDGIDRVLHELAGELARVHAERWRRLHERNAASGPYRPDAVSMARRSLGHVALGFVVRGLGATAAGALLDRLYAAADNLTDRRAVLLEATHHEHVPGAIGARLLDNFLERWRHEALVVNQWFSLQASSPLYDAERVAALTRHAAFDARNPNKLRAVYGAFAQNNHRNFHASDGHGYAFLGDAVLQLDHTNSQVAARLATPLTRWRRYDPVRQQAMRGVLERIAAAAGLSKDLFEVASKGLGGA